MAWPTASARSKNWGTEVLTDTDLEAQLDLLHTYFNDSLNGTTGHDHSGGTNEGPKIVLTAAAGVSGTLPVTNGGTGQATLAAFLNLIYPVGSVYINVSDSTNPGTLLGFGTWSALGAGRMIVGYDSGDTNFDSAGETGGANTVTIDQANLPSYNLSFTRYDGNGSGSTGVQGTTNGASGTSQTVASGGSGTALTVLNKYVTCYTWKRTA